MRIELRCNTEMTLAERALLAAHVGAEAFDDPRFAATVRAHYGYDVYRLTAFADNTENAPIGMLTLTHVRSRLWGDALIAPAFFVVGGALLPNDPLPLLHAARNLGESLGVDRIEIRLRSLPILHETIPRLKIDDTTYALFRAPIITDIELLPRKARADVRRALQNPSLRSDCGDFDAFMYCYRRSLRDLGTPMHAPRFYRTLYESLPARIDTVRRNGEPLCAVMSFLNQNAVLPYYGGGMPAAREHDAFDRMYFDLMRDAAMQGYTMFDFGRSKRGTGAFDYKRRRGFAPQPSVHLHWPIGDKPLPELNPLNPRYARAARIWRRLPLPVVDVIGPMLARQLA